MLSCLTSLLILVLVVVIVLWIAETAVSALITLPPPVWTLVRLILGLVVLVSALQCFGLAAEVWPLHWCR